MRTTIPFPSSFDGRRNFLAKNTGIIDVHNKQRITHTGTGIIGVPIGMTHFGHRLCVAFNHTQHVQQSLSLLMKLSIEQ